MPELIRGFLSRYALVGVWLAMAALFAAIRPQVFLTPAILDTIFGTQSVLVVLSLALLITLIAGDFDLSAASVLGMSATLIVTLNTNGGLSIGVCVALALVAGMVTGVVNGILVVYVGVDAIVATLGMGTLLLGLAELISGGVTIGNIDQSLVRAATDTLLGLHPFVLCGTLHSSHILVCAGLHAFGQAFESCWRRSGNGTSRWHSRPAGAFRRVRRFRLCKCACGSPPGRSAGRL